MVLVNTHFKRVTEKVAELNLQTYNDMFLNQEFREEGVKEAIERLHKRKACGYDGISTEHLVYGGHTIRF